jgi:DNA-binding NarL/FixJ family response regulator
VRDLRPDVAVVDISLHGSDGLELTKSIRAERPDLPVLIVSMHDEALYAERALHAGASGYIMKQEVSTQIVSALRTVLEGGTYLSDEMRERLALAGPANQANARPQTGVEALTDRELEVFSLIGHGVSTRSIAEQLHLSVKTVETHRAHIKTKLQVDTAPELVRRAVQWVEKEQDG